MIACVFPGQGSQRSGMGRPWVERPSWHVVTSVSEVTGCNVAHLLLDADDEELRVTRNTQLSLFALELVVWSELADLGVQPAVVAGHSLGELSALVVAGVLSVEDGARLVTSRAQAMDEAGRRCPGTMAAVVGLDVDKVEALCNSVPQVWVSAENTPDQVTVAGSVGGVEAIKQSARDAGAKRVLPLNVAGAFHTPFMADALPNYDAQLCETPMRLAAVDVVANVDASVHRNPVRWRAMLLAQITSRVLWRQTMEQFASAGVGFVIEVGPGRALATIAQRMLGVPAVSLDGPDPVQRLSEVAERRASLAGPSEVILVHSSDAGTASVPGALGTVTTEGELLTEGTVLAWIDGSPQRAPCAGWLLEVLIAEGDPVATGQPLARLHRL